MKRILGEARLRSIVAIPLSIDQTPLGVLILAAPTAGILATKSCRCCARSPPTCPYEGENHLLAHLSFGVSDLARTTAFYDACMRALGYDRVFTGPGSVGYGRPGTTIDRLLLILQLEPPRPPGPGFHLAFIAPNRQAINLFHAAALEFGGTDQGAPALRPQYGPNYYAAFVLDPDGYKLEAKHPPPGDA
jgi:catechol 2,3-dioxygenase-like lactoylglutathione lyase family enzyme